MPFTQLYSSPSTLLWEDRQCHPGHFCLFFIINTLILCIVTVIIYLLSLHKEREERRGETALPHRPPSHKDHPPPGSALSPKTARPQRPSSTRQPKISLFFPLATCFLLSSLSWKEKFGVGKKSAKFEHPPPPCGAPPHPSSLHSPV